MSNKLLKQAGAMLMSLAFAAAPVAGVMAAPEDIINMNQKGSINIHKYDITAMTEDGIDVSAIKSNGEENQNFEADYANYVIEGVEFTYAKVAEINQVTEAGSVEVMYDIPKELETILKLEDTRGDHMHSSTELNDAMKNLLSNNTAGKNALERYIDTVHGHASVMTDSCGEASITNAPVGLYLLVETKVPANVHTTVDPFFVTIPMTKDDGSSWFYNVHVYPKNQTDIPDLDKVVRQHDDVEYKKPEFGDSATGSEGDVMDYLFVSHLPKITSASTYLSEYTFVDKMDKGLTYNKDAAIYFYDNEADAKANNAEKAKMVWKHDSAYFSETYDGANSDYNQMTIQPTAAGLVQIDPGFSQNWIVVSYSATVNSDATPVLGDAGNTNDVTLTWKRTNMDKSDTLEDRARVYTYGLNITKKATESDKPFDFTKVQFVLQNKTDGHYIVAKQSGAGVYYVTDATKGAAEENGTKFTPASDGKLIINGLEANTYVMTEIQTSDGYALLKEPITIDIKSTTDTFVASKTTLYDIYDINSNPNKKMIETNGERASAKVDGNNTAMSVDAVKNVQSTNARVDMTVTNVPSTILPMTGGTGTIICTLIGCGVALVGIVFVMGKKNKKAE